MFKNMFKRRAACQDAAEPKKIEVWNPLLNTTVPVDEVLAPLARALFELEFDLVHCSRDTTTGDVTVGFASNWCASNFLSIAVFANSATIDRQLVEAVVMGTGGWRCETLVRFIASNPSYQKKGQSLPPLYINLLVRFPGQYLDHVTSVFKTLNEAKGKPRP
jgi:hypothetical protein